MLRFALLALAFGCRAPSTPPDPAPAPPMQPKVTKPPAAPDYAHLQDLALEGKAVWSDADLAAFVAGDLIGFHADRSAHAFGELHDGSRGIMIVDTADAGRQFEDVVARKPAELRAHLAHLVPVAGIKLADDVAVIGTARVRWRATGAELDVELAGKHHVERFQSLEAKRAWKPRAAFKLPYSEQVIVSLHDDVEAIDRLHVFGSDDRDAHSNED